MTAKEDLFILIKSLSKTEKAYFKKFTSLHSNEGQKIYLKLFDYINAMPSYQEQELRQKMELLGVKQLSVYKNYLYKIILRSQAQYSRSHSENYNLDEWIQEIEVLMAKNLFSQCVSLIQKVKNNAKEHENFIALLKVIDLEIRLIKQSPSVKNWKKMYEDAVSEEAQALKKMKDIAQTRDLNAEMFLFLQTHTFLSQTAESRQNLENLYKKIENYPLPYSSAECAINHLSAYVNYYKFIQKPEGGHPYQFQAIEIFEEHPFLIENAPLRYVNSLSNLLILEMMKSDELGFMNALTKLNSVENFVPKALFSPNLQLHVFALSLRHELSFYVRFEKAETGKVVIEKNEEKLLTSRHLINEIFFLHIAYCAARIYFQLGLSHKVAHWLQLILQTPQNEYNPKYHFQAKMLLFILFWESEEYDFLKSLFVSIQNLVKKYKLQGEFELGLLSLLLEAKKKTETAYFLSQKAKIAAYLVASQPSEPYFSYWNWWKNKEESPAS